MGNKKLLITGAAGFIGARAVDACRTESTDIISVDRLDAFDRNEHQSIDFGTKVDLEDLFQWLKTHSPKLDGVIHMGACSDTTERDPEVFKKLNTDYSQKIWNYCATHQIPLVYASSAATYGDGTQGFNDIESEMKDLKPLNLYGQSKLDFDLWALEQEQKGNTPPTWSGLKFFNVYGFGEAHKNHMSSLVFKAFKQIQDKGEVKLFKSHKEGIEDGMQSRDFVHVDDIVDQVWFCLNNAKRGIYNSGTGKARAFLDLVKAVFHSLQKEEKINWIDTPAELREQYQYFTEANMSRLKGLGYSKAPLTLEQGVDKTIKDLIENQSQL